MEQVFETVMVPATGLMQVVETGQGFRVTDLEGLQVGDVVVLNANKLCEKLSTFYSRMRTGVAGQDGFHPRDRLFEGDLLMSTINNEMMRMTVDTPEAKGMQDCMCDRYLYRALGQG